MSTLLTRKISVGLSYSRLAEVKEWNAPAVLRGPNSNGSKVGSMGSTDMSVASSKPTPERNIKRSEWCFITKSPSYVHQRAHWINAVRGDENRKLKKKIETFLASDLRIVPDGFDLNHVHNLTNLDPMLHTAMDKFAMFAVTCSMASLDALIALIEEENRKVQEATDEVFNYSRSIHFIRPPVSNADYELVVLHGKHFLPDGSSLTRYIRADDGRILGKQDYAIDITGVLREAPANATSPRFPSFTFDFKRSVRLNPFLVVLSAEIKFRRFNRLPQRPKLDSHYEQLIERTIKLADLIYEKPVVRPNTMSAEFFPSYAMDLDSGLLDREFGYRRRDPEDEDDDPTIRSNDPGQGSGVKRPLTAIEGRKEYWQHLLSGRDQELDDDDEAFLEEMENSYQYRNGSLHSATLPVAALA